MESHLERSPLGGLLEVECAVGEDTPRTDILSRFPGSASCTMEDVLHMGLDNSKGACEVHRSQEYREALQSIQNRLRSQPFSNLYYSSLTRISQPLIHRSLPASRCLDRSNPAAKVKPANGRRNAVRNGLKALHSMLCITLTRHLLFRLLVLFCILLRSAALSSCTLCVFSCSPPTHFATLVTSLIDS